VIIGRERCLDCGGSGDADTYAEADYPACAACGGEGVAPGFTFFCGPVL
jgi:DnaJ-class molecular chaperone